MELDDLMELDHLQDLQQCMLLDRYTHEYILGDCEDHLIIAQQDLDDQAQLTQAPAGVISSRFMQHFPDHLEHLDHSHNQLRAAELGCKLLRSSCDPSELHNDQVNCTAPGTTAEADDQQAAGSRSKYQLNCTASGRSEEADDQKSAGIMSENQINYTAAEENGDQKAAGMRTKCFKRRLEQCSLINSESDQYGDLNNDESRFDKYSLMNDQSTDHSAAAASSEEEGGTSCCSKQEKNKMMNLERSSSITSGTTVISSNSVVDKVRRDAPQQSTMITKRARPTAAPCINVPRPQYRLPIIIHTYSPKIIHTHPSKFMWLVQSLTGSSETRSRCLNGQPPDQYHSIHADQDNSAAFMEAQPNHQPQYSAGSPSAASMGADHHAHQQSLPNHAIIHPKPIRYINQVNDQNVNKPSNQHINQSLSNVIINNNPSLISPKTPTNHPNNLINYKDQCNRMSEGAEIRGCTSDTSASCCTSTTIEVSPRGNFSGSEVSPSWGPFSATELEGATAVQEELFILSRGSSACNSVPSPAPPVFENWALEHWCPDHNQTSCLSNLNQYETDLNNLSNLTNHNLNYHSNLNVAPREQGFSFNYPS